MSKISAISIALQEKAYQKLLKNLTDASKVNLEKDRFYTGKVLNKAGEIVRYKDGFPVSNAQIKDGKVVYCCRCPYGEDVFVHTRGRNDVPNDKFHDTISTLNGITHFITEA